MSHEVLAIDIGGTNIRGAIVDQQGYIHEQIRQKSNFTDFPHTDPTITNQLIIHQICTFITSLIGSQNTIKKVAVGFPGFIHQPSGILIASPNIPSLIDYPLADQLSRTSGYEVTVYNDGLCAAVGEFHFGVGFTSKMASLLHCTLGTGIGGGLVLQGKPYTGERGMALELGHVKVEAHGRSCGCGSRGCLETRASASAVVADYKQHTGQQKQAKEIYECALRGDKTASVVIQRAGWYLGLGIAQAATLLDIGHFSIGGGLANAWPLLEPAIHEALSDKLFPAQRSQIRIHKSKCMDDAGILGAVILANH